MSHLRAMVREGMARIVVTDGEILSKLTFNVSTSDVQESRQSQYHRDSANAYIRGSAWAPWGRASAGAGWNQVNVRTANESTTGRVDMTAQIIGQVKINFKSETFPPADAGPIV